MDVETRLAQIEQRLDEYEQSLAKTAKKDLWDRFNQIGPILITLAIAAGGWVVTDMMKQIDINNSERQAVAQENATRTSTRVSQAQLVSTFLDPLFSSDPDKQKLAIGALLIALPEEGPQLVQTISSTTDDKEVEAFAAAALDDRRTDLLTDLFSADDELRTGAEVELVHGWTRDTRLIEALLAQAHQNLEFDAGINSAFSVLFSMDLDLLNAHRADVLALLDAKGPWKDSTKRLAEQVREKLASNP